MLVLMLLRPEPHRHHRATEIHLRGLDKPGRQQTNYLEVIPCTGSLTRFLCAGSESCTRPTQLLTFSDSSARYQFKWAAVRRLFVRPPHSASYLSSWVYSVLSHT